MIFTRSDLPKLTGGDRRRQPPRNARNPDGNDRVFGTYEINEAKRTILYKSEGTTFP